MSQPWNPSQRSLKVIESGTIRKTVYGFLLVFCLTLSLKRDIRLQNCRDLENRVTSASEMVLKFIELRIMLVETTHLTQGE